MRMNVTSQKHTYTMHNVFLIADTVKTENIPAQWNNLQQNDNAATCKYVASKTLPRFSVFASAWNNLHRKHF